MTLAVQAMSEKRAKLERSMRSLMPDAAVQERAKYKVALQRNAELIKDCGGALRPMRARDAGDRFVVMRVLEAIAMTQEMVAELEADDADALQHEQPPRKLRKRRAPRATKR
jgi:hypothetical protein